MQWHQSSLHELLQDILQTSRNGLNAEEAQARIHTYGLNKLMEKKKKSLLMLFLDQFKDFMIIVLLIAAVLSGIIGDVVDTLAIIIIVLLNAIMGFVQEYRAEKAMEALKKMAAPLSTVIRDGEMLNIPSETIVPGDVVVLEAGKIIPADLRLMEVAQLKVEEAALTGESIPVEKMNTEIPEENIPLGDRKNMAYKGTIVTYGRGIGAVVATGMKTELGKIAQMIQAEEDGKTPLQKRLIAFGKKLSLAIFVVCAIVFITGYIRGEETMLMLLTAVSLAVAAIPEALPAVVIISLAMGARKLVKQNALISKLPAVETLGSVTFICSDKTGTLTQNKMEVETIVINGSVIHVGGMNQTDTIAQSNSLFFHALALNNDAYIDAAGTILGDPTETALFKLAKNFHFDKDSLTGTLPRINEIPFDSERKAMTTIHQNNGSSAFDKTYISFTKGAVDMLIDKSNSVLTHEGIVPLDKSKILSMADSLSENGLRILAIAMRQYDTLPQSITPDTIEDNLVLLGLAAMIDPPREEAREAVEMCKAAGIKPVMITGDHPLTAKSIAERLAISDEGRPLVLTGKELEELSMEEFEEKVESISVYARVAPEQKLKIVKGLQDKGQYVAMTGDGVNDAPALKRADIGVAMGITGTDVSKEAAHMILLDDNFATIVKAVKEGRRIFDNIRKFIKYAMTSNTGEVLVIFLAPLLGYPIPLLPIHILWLNLVTDGLPGLALAYEKADKRIMNRPPRHPNESVFSHGIGIHIVWVGMLMGTVGITTQILSLSMWENQWQTIVFTVLTFGQMGHVMAIRSDTQSVFTIGVFSNKPLLGAIAVTVGLQFAIIYVPFLNPIFKTQPLSLEQIGIIMLFSLIPFIAVETEKFVIRLKERKRLGTAK